MFPVIFRFISGEISAEKISKDLFLNFRGSLLSNFWAIVLISAVISILVDFGSLLQARTVTVKEELGLYPLKDKSFSIRLR